MNEYEHKYEFIHFIHISCIFLVFVNFVNNSFSFIIKRFAQEVTVNSANIKLC